MILAFELDNLIAADTPDNSPPPPQLTITTSTSIFSFHFIFSIN